MRTGCPTCAGFVRALADVDLAALADAETEPGWADDGSLRTALLRGRADEVVPAAVRARAHRRGDRGAHRRGLQRGVRAPPRATTPRSSATTTRTSGGSTSPTASPTRPRPAGRGGPSRGPTRRGSPSGPPSSRATPVAAGTPRWSSRPLEPDGADLPAAIAAGRFDESARAALAGDPDDVAAQLVAAALDDHAGSFIVAAHVVKTTGAALSETAATGSRLPLAAAARFMTAPRKERFVTGNVIRSIDFLSGRGPAERVTLAESARRSSGCDETRIC